MFVSKDRLTLQKLMPNHRPYQLKQKQGSGRAEYQKPQNQFIMQVHDELVFEVPLEVLQKVGSEISRLMADVAHL